MSKSEIMSCVVAFCDSQKWKYRVDEDCLYTGFCIQPTGGVQYRTTIMARDDGILVYVYVPIGGCTLCGGELDSLICRLNERLVNGNFECVQGSSDVRYKIYLSCIGVESRIPALLMSAIELAIRMVVVNEARFRT